MCVRVYVIFVLFVFCLCATLGKRITVGIFLDTNAIPPFLQKRCQDSRRHGSCFGFGGVVAQWCELRDGIERRIIVLCL